MINNCESYAWLLLYSLGNGRPAFICCGKIRVWISKVVWTTGVDFGSQLIQVSLNINTWAYNVVRGDLKI